MKRTSVLLAAFAALLLFAAGALAINGPKIRADVPFAFYVGEEQLPAGNYVFQMRAVGFGSASSSAVAIYRQDGSLAVMVATIPEGWAYRTVADGHLHFTRYSNTYFLNKVEGPDSGASLTATRAERELRAQNTQGRDTVIVAQRRFSQTRDQ